jgi:hypothetical protein
MRTVIEITNDLLSDGVANVGHESLPSRGYLVPTRRALIIPGYESDAFISNSTALFVNKYRIRANQPGFYFWSRVTVRDNIHLSVTRYFAERAAAELYAYDKDVSAIHDLRSRLVLFV